jgi:hypothetical protein
MGEKISDSMMSCRMILGSLDSFPPFPLLAGMTIVPGRVRIEIVTSKRQSKAALQFQCHNWTEEEKKKENTMNAQGILLTFCALFSPLFLNGTIKSEMTVAAGVTAGRECGRW